MMQRLTCLLLLLIFLTSCSCNNEPLLKPINIITYDKDSLLVDTLMKQQKFILVNIKIDSILPLKPINQRGYYYLQKSFSCLMLEHHQEAISNFEQAVQLGYKIEASRSMIVTAKEMKRNYDQYN